MVRLKVGAMDSRKFRNIAGRFATGVTVVTSVDKQGRPVGMTANSFTSLSLDPPLVLFCIDKKASLYPVFMGASAFAVNILSAEQEHLSRQFAAKDIDRFAGVAYREGVTRSPILDDVLGYFDCQVEARYDGGDHTIMVGRVVDGQERDGAPLIFFSGQYQRLQEK